MTNKQILKKLNNQLKKISPEAIELVKKFSVGIPTKGLSISELNKEIN